MSRVLIWHDKHEDAVFTASTEAELHASALYILTERVELGYILEDEEDFTCAYDAIEDADGAAAYQLLQRRSREGYEYEAIETKEVRS